MIALGLLLFVTAAGLWILTLVFATGETAQYVGLQLGMIAIIFGGIVLIMAKFWTQVYPILKRLSNLVN